jgi:hypothetical protein
MSTDVPCMNNHKTHTVPCVEQLDGLHRSRSCRDFNNPNYIAVAWETGPTAPKRNECPLMHRFEIRPGVVLEASE